MVCLGNICRSPLAQGILETKIKLNKLNIEVDSAGTGSWHAGSPPDDRSIEIANYYNIDITLQRARQFKESDFDNFQMIYVMDTSNYNDVINKTLNVEDKKKVKLILDEIYPGENKSVPDPYYGGNNGFNNVYVLLEKACEQIILKLLK